MNRFKTFEGFDLPEMKSVLELIPDLEKLGYKVTVKEREGAPDWRKYIEVYDKEFDLTWECSRIISVREKGYYLGNGDESKRFSFSGDNVFKILYNQYLPFFTKTRKFLNEIKPLKEVMKYTGISGTLDFNIVVNQKEYSLLKVYADLFPERKMGTLRGVRFQEDSKGELLMYILTEDINRVQSAEPFGHLIGGGLLMGIFRVAEIDIKDSIEFLAIHRQDKVENFKKEFISKFRGQLSGKRFGF